MTKSVGLNLINKTSSTIYYPLTLSVAISNLLCLVNIQAWQLDLEGLMTEGFAKSAEMPYAELPHSQRGTTSCCVSGMKKM